MAKPKTTNLVIDKNVPLPPPRAFEGARKKRKRPADKYKLYSLQPKESVFVPGLKHGTISGYIYGFKKRWEKVNPNAPPPKFAMRTWKQNGLVGLRIFRTE